MKKNTTSFTFPTTKSGWKRIYFNAIKAQICLQIAQTRTADELMFVLGEHFTGIKNAAGEPSPKSPESEAKPAQSKRSAPEYSSR